MEGLSMALTPEEERLIQHEEFISRIIAVRSGDRPPSARKSRLQEFLESAGGAALLTVLIGGLAGSLISAQFQRAAKGREFQQAFLRARADQSLAAYRQHLQSELAATQRIFDEVGAAISSANDLLDLTEPPFDPARFPPDRQPRIREQRSSIAHQFNEAAGRWRRDKESLGLVLAYYHPSASIINVWSTLQKSIDDLLECAEQYYDRWPDTKSSKSACRNQEKVVRSGLLDLQRELQKVRRYPWEWLDSPGNVRKQLEALPNR